MCTITSPAVVVCVHFYREKVYSLVDVTVTSYNMRQTGADWYDSGDVHPDVFTSLLQSYLYSINHSSSVLKALSIVR